ncbi:hypothetical protein Purlil1_6842 [Purpureocillium lilacinum]|uniref:Uncharacterized protein n=1 Tax=Purpureocillium lilacinum TaxID=33203 RepID=A0ABR0BY58_PURLI|nr:hypothetical protein Purlil1_6842 [Purpureocillium lilacinum]
MEPHNMELEHTSRPPGALELSAQAGGRAPAPVLGPGVSPRGLTQVAGQRSFHDPTTPAPRPPFPRTPQLPPPPSLAVVAPHPPPSLRAGSPPAFSGLCAAQNVIPIWASCPLSVTLLSSFRCDVCLSILAAITFDFATLTRDAALLESRLHILFAPGTGRRARESAVVGRPQGRARRDSIHHQRPTDTHVQHHRDFAPDFRLRTSIEPFEADSAPRKAAHCRGPTPGVDWDGSRVHEAQAHNVSAWAPLSPPSLPPPPPQ